MTSRGRGLAAVGTVLTLAVAPLLVWIGATAQAAQAPVTIVYGDLNGFRPASVTIANGGFVRWTNSGGTSVTISGHNAVCAFSLTVAGFSTSPSIGPFPSGGTCHYTGVTVLATNSAVIIVSARPGPPKPSPTGSPAGPPPSPSASASPSSPSAGPTPSGGGSPGASPAPSGSPGARPTASARPTAGVSDPGVTPIVGSGPGTGGTHLRTDGVYVTRSPQRAVGLLAAVSLTLVAGLIAGLLRVLMAEPIPSAGPDVRGTR